MKIFAIFDKVSKTFDWVSTSVNVQMFIRTNLKFICQQRPLCDLELYEIGEHDEVSGLIKAYDTLKLCDWNDYKYPETKAEQLSPLEFDKIKDSVDKKEVR